MFILQNGTSQLSSPSQSLLKNQQIILETTQAPVPQKMIIPKLNVRAETQTQGKLTVTFAECYYSVFIHHSSSLHKIATFTLMNIFRIQVSDYLQLRPHLHPATITITIRVPIIICLQPVHRLHLNNNNGRRMVAV